jgi:site-specific recombinase XerD
MLVQRVLSPATRLESSTVLSEFIAWLRRPPVVRAAVVAVLPSREHHCSPSMVNRKLSALSAFYQHAARNGVDLGELLTTWLTRCSQSGNRSVMAD